MRKIVIAAAAIAAVTVGHAYADTEQYPSGPFLSLHTSESTTPTMRGQTSAARTAEPARSGWHVAAPNPRGFPLLATSGSAHDMPMSAMALSTNGPFFQSSGPRDSSARLNGDMTSHQAWTTVNSGGGAG